MTDRKEDVLDRLEKTIARLADGTAPLDELVAAHGSALKLLEEAEEELAAIRSKADDLTR